MLVSSFDYNHSNSECVVWAYNKVKACDEQANFSVNRRVTLLIARSHLPRVYPKTEHDIPLVCVGDIWLKRS